jgi:16S rRNA processing protein RimM
LKNYFKVGKLVSTYGLKGEVVLKHDLGKKTSLKNLEAFFIEEKTDAFLPYFIQSTKIKNDKEIYIKLEGINSKEIAHKLVQNEVWLLEDDFKKFAAGSAPISLLGFSMVNNNQDLGEILEVIEQPHQVLCKILINGTEALIPVHQDSLEKIDKKNRKVFVDLPEGLLDIYKASSSSKRN